MTVSGTVAPAAKSTLLRLVEKESRQQVMSCYQCGKCTAGCPMAQTVDLGPRQVMRAVQVGLREEALRNDLIWLCLACQTCTVRCPRQIDVAGVMEALRHIAVAEGVKPAAKDMGVFHRVFLESVKRGGRVYELGLGGAFNILSGRPLANTRLLPRMLAKGKLDLLPKRAKGQAEVEEIFRRVAEIEGQLPGLELSKETAAKGAVAAAAFGLGALAGAKVLGKQREAGDE